MDYLTVIVSVLTSVGASVGLPWLMRRLIDHRFAKDLKDYQQNLDNKLAVAKAKLDEQLATTKANVEAILRKEVEEHLGDKAAERQYRLDAQKRLYTVIGPLKFQLVRACADFANRVEGIGKGKHRFPTSISGYFGRSTVFRLLRLFAIAELIERQTAHADFSVDPSMVKFLMFKHEAFRCLSHGTISLNHPKTKWDEQVEHVFYDRLSIIAAAAIHVEDDKARAMRFDEFEQFISDDNGRKAIHPIPRLFEDFTVSAKPILWVRLVALAQLCHALAETEAPTIGIPLEPFDGLKMLEASHDEFLVQHHKKYCQMLHDVAASIAAPAISGPK